MGKTKGGLPRGSLMDVDELRPASSSARQPASSAGGFGAHASPSSSGGWTGMAVDGQPAGRQPAAQRKNKNGQRGAARGGRNGRGGAQAQHQRQQGRSHAQVQVQQHGHDAGSSSMDLDSPAGVASNDNGYHDSEFMSDAAIGMILSSGAAAGRGAGGFLSAGMGLDDGGAGEDASLTAGNTRDRSNLPEAGDGAQAALELLEEQSMAKKAKQQFAKAQRAGNLMDDGTGMIPFSRARAFPSGELVMLDASELTPIPSSLRKTIDGTKRVGKRKVTAKSNRKKIKMFEMASNRAAQSATRLAKLDVKHALREKFKHLY